MAAERRTCLTLEAFEAVPIPERLGGRHYADGRDKTLFMELVDLCEKPAFLRLGSATTIPNASIAVPVPRGRNPTIRQRRE